MILNGGKLIYRYIVISDIHNKTRGRRRSTFGYFIKKKSINADNKATGEMGWVH